jgi:hypothetical protein
MNKSRAQKQHRQSPPGLNEDELCQPGVGKVLLENNKRLIAEVDSLKKSLRVSQNELEKLRSKYHELDKKTAS